MSIRRHFPLLCPFILACGADPGEVATDTVDRPFSTALNGEPNHEQITADALPFLRPEILLALQAADVAVDLELALVNAHHFDDCNFSGGAQVIREAHTEAAAALDPAGDPLESDALALRAFARVLHAAQDFYAHANWVESGGDQLVEATLGEWPAWAPYEILPSGFVLVQGPPPRRTSLSRRERAPYPQSAQVELKRGRERAAGIISGSVDYEPGELCPREVRMTHDELAKDSSDTPGRAAEHRAAYALAVEQTHHEWCRLRARVAATWGEAGVARLDAWSADPAAATCTE